MLSSSFITPPAARVHILRAAAFSRRWALRFMYSSAPSLSRVLCPSNTSCCILVLCTIEQRSTSSYVRVRAPPPPPTLPDAPSNRLQRMVWLPCAHRMAVCITVSSLLAVHHVYTHTAWLLCIYSQPQHRTYQIKHLLSSGPFSCKQNVPLHAPLVVVFTLPLQDREMRGSGLGLPP